MLKKFTNGCTNLVERYLPDPFVIAIILTIVTYIAAVVYTDSTPMQVLGYWGNFRSGFWNLLAFTMQTCVMVIFGCALADTPFFRGAIDKVASYATDSKKAIIIVTLFSGLMSWLNFGLGQVCGALLACEIARRVRNVDYRLLIASAYSSYVIWHMGLSGTIPLTIATSFKMGERVISAPILDTMFHPVNLITAVVTILVLVFINTRMHPDPEHTVSVDISLLRSNALPKYVIETPSDRIDHSKILWLATSILGFSYIGYYFYGIVQSGSNILNGLNRDSLSMVFLFLGILLHGDLRRYLDSLKKSASTTTGVMLCFPFYAGIMAIMVGTDASGVNLASIISNFFVSISNEITFPMFSFLSAGLVNIAIPSGGGQWAAQGPIIMQAAEQLGVDTSVAAMSIAWGDQWTNMIQPFWALPALSIANLKARDIMGYMVIVTLVTGVIFCLGMLVWAIL